MVRPAVNFPPELPPCGIRRFRYWSGAGAYCPRQAAFPWWVLRGCPGFLRLVVALLVGVLALADSRVQGATLYWDANGTNPGAATGTVASGTWGVDAFWSTDSAGLLSPSILTTTLADDLLFAAGLDATGSSTLTISGGQQANGLTFNAGTVSLGGTASPVLTLGGGGLTMGSGLGGTLTLGASLGSVVVGASQTWANESSRQLVVQSAVAGSAAAGATTTWTVGGTGVGGMT
ncbi:MAG: hypothetical protein RLZZ142_2374, partial [Verrucomicrobiota bacterium]